MIPLQLEVFWEVVYSCATPKTAVISNTGRSFFKFLENRVENDVLSHSVDDQSSTNDGNVEAIAEAFPEEPIEGAVQYDQDEPYQEVIPLNAAPATEAPPNTNQAPKQEISVPVPDEQQQVQPTESPKKKVHISLDIPDNTEIHDETENDDDDAYAPQRPQKPNRPATAGGSPMYTFFPVTFGRAAGGTIAVANAYSTGKGAVRSHAIAYGTSGASRRQAIERQRHIAAQKKAH